ncbi:4'-phosphopantetheinyl transferase family protein [Arsenophonus endosymbiont of Crataerina pallida]|uniref:4'-phosphopantetheinyl transferase family protein n=1 Tax=Arsenophonus endosymbiont of Crataerina pallida TaxID=3066235 RepID=UPI0030CED422
MFTSITTGSMPPFIRSFEVGTITSLPGLRYCLINFDIRCYQDALFTYFAIPFPQTLSSAVVKRRAEYIAVRYAAKILLRTAGCNNTPGIGQDRAPAWPSGWCGSLSHTDGHAIALVSPQEADLILGVDIETFSSLTIRQTANLFSSLDEQALLADSGIDYEIALLVTFSAKESLFKALYPEVRYFFGFEAARVCKIDILHQRITLELTQTLTQNRKKGSQIAGYYVMRDNQVITLFA